MADVTANGLGAIWPEGLLGFTLICLESVCIESAGQVLHSSPGLSFSLYASRIPLTLTAFISAEYLC